ncbi:MAG: CHAD domain-containing protein, partial [Acidobacteriota bacterium]|nr:CHAD domain-containing protein [Acidobacteriota bacterium]
LQPTMRADEAVLTILRRLFETMRANEDGTRRGLDSEFLHDFRVAARRTRSCLGQVKGVFEKEASRRFRREFAWLGEVTGPTRDLDVFLLQMREHRIEQTESLRSGLEHAAEYLRDRQKVEQRRLAGALASERYMKLTRDWSAFLERAPRDDGEGLPPDASRPATEVASERIWRAFRRVFKRGNALEPGAPPEAIHRLRIDCKKLRYLMEFFKSLFLREQISSPIRALRRLQDCLGDYNDLEMQQGELRKIAAELQARGDATAGTLLAVDSLIGTLGERQKKMKGAVIETVAAFVENRNRAAFRELLR